MDNRRIAILNTILFVLALLVVLFLVFKFKLYRRRRSFDDRSVLPESRYPSFIQIVTVEGQNLVENDTSKYIVKKYSNKSFLAYDYEFKEGAKCVEVKFNYKRVWRYDFDSSSSNYPKTIMFDVNEKTILFKFDDDDFALYIYKDNEWRSSYHPGSKIFLELDVDTREGSLNYDYESTSSEDSAKYIAKKGKYFKTVKCGDNELFAAKNFSELSEEVLVSVRGDVKFITVISLKGTIHKFHVKRPI